MSIEAMKQALEALENVTEDYVKNRQYKHNKAIESLRQAIASEESSVTQEPVAWLNENESVDAYALSWHKNNTHTIPLYTHPQPKVEQEPVAKDWRKEPWGFGEKRLLTVEETPLQPKPQQEPVAMRYDFDGYGYKYIDSGSGSDWQTRIKDAEPVYTHPKREWVGLTDEEKTELWEVSRAALPRCATYARLVEAKLKEKNT